MNSIGTEGDLLALDLAGLPCRSAAPATAPVQRGAVRRLMGANEIQAVKCLQQVKFPPGSWDKRFARSMAGMTTITDKEAPQVWRLLKRYLRQISHPDKALLLTLANDLAAPDFRAQRALELQRVRYAQSMGIAPK